MLGRMTFEDEVTEVHYQDFMQQLNSTRFKLILGGGMGLIVVLSFALICAMGAFGYAAALVIAKKGASGLAMEPWIVGLILAGVATCLIGAFFLCFEHKTFRLFWSQRKGPKMDPGALREGINLGPATFSLGETGLKIRMPLDHDEFDWRAFSHFHETEDTMVLMFNQHIGVVMPKAKLIASGLLEDARSMIAANLPLEA